MSDVRLHNWISRVGEVAFFINRALSRWIQVSTSGTLARYTYHVLELHPGQGISFPKQLMASSILLTEVAVWYIIVVTRTLICSECS